jgi:hypothetical protein
MRSSLVANIFEYFCVAKVARTAAYLNYLQSPILDKSGP